ncbi:MAG: DUF6056 family protein [Bacilli bacterium]|nr:DUF6056 family protein [Bacilli bacterium]
MTKEKNSLCKDLLKSKEFLFLAFIFIIIAVMSYYSPYTPDDYNYSNYPWTTNRIKSFTDIIFSQMIMYKQWSGRILFSGLGQWFLFAGTFIYAICNAGAFTYLVYKIAHFSKPKKPFIALILSFFLLWNFIPAFAEDFIWLSGSVNYLWPTLFTFLFFDKFSKVYIKEKDELNQKNFILLVILAFITGLSHEMTFFLAAGIGFSYIVFNFKKVWKSDYRLKTIIASFILGGVILIASPGNFARATGSLGLDYSIIILNIKANIWLFIISFISILFFLFKEKKIGVFYLKYSIIPIFISLLPMLMIHEFPLRAMLIINVFLMLPIVHCLSRLLGKIKKGSTLLEILLILLTIYVPIKVGLYYGNNVKEYNRETQFMIDYSKKVGQQDIVLNTLSLPTNINSKYFLSIFTRPNIFKNGVSNVYFCKYYGCKTVVSKGSENIIVEIELKEDSLNDIQLKLGENIVDDIAPTAVMPENQKQYKDNIIFEIPKVFEKDFVIISNQDANNIKKVTIYDIDQTITLDSIKVEK